MSYKLILPFFCFLGLILIFSFDDREDDPKYTPVLMKREVFENSIKLLPVKELQKPGKIYFKDNYIFISEKYKGVHIIDNRNPEAPVNMGFIQVDGCLDMAIKYNTLYVDHATDLVAIDLSRGFLNPEVKFRKKDVFPELKPPDGSAIPKMFSKNKRPENTVIVNWELQN